MRQPKEVKIEGLPNCVTVVQNKKDLFADLFLENPEPSIQDMIHALQKLDSLGFKYFGVTYDYGYYESIDNKRMQFIKYHNQ